jgi:hypothetical protein
MKKQTRSATEEAEEDRILEALRARKAMLDEAIRAIERFDFAQHSELKAPRRGRRGVARPASARTGLPVELFRVP